MAVKDNENNGLSNLDAPQILRDVHEEDDRALRTLSINELVPRAFNKVELEYITLGNGVGEIGKAIYHSNGTANRTVIKMQSDYLGIPEVSKFEFNGITATSLSGKYFIIYDTLGTVGVWFDVDNLSTLPITGALRDIEIDIASGDSASTIANKFKLVMDADAQYISTVGSTLAMVTSAQIGDKTNASDVNTNILITIINGNSPVPLNNKYFYLNSANDDTEYYVWYDVNNTGVDPAVVGKTPIEVDIVSGESASGVATKTKNAINLLEDEFVAESSDDIVTITNRRTGVTTDTVDFNTGHIYFKTTRDGSDKRIVATIIITYNGVNEIITAERLD